MRQRSGVVVDLSWSSLRSSLSHPPHLFTLFVLSSLLCYSFLAVHTANHLSSPSSPSLSSSSSPSSSSLSLSLSLSERERRIEERERELERERERQREREREREKECVRTERERTNDSEREGERESKGERRSGGESERARETERERESERASEREGERERERESEAAREGERLGRRLVGARGTNPPASWRKVEWSAWGTIVFPKYKLIMCTIAKVACSLLRKLALIVNGPDNWDLDQENSSKRKRRSFDAEKLKLQDFHDSNFHGTHLIRRKDRWGEEEVQEMFKTNSSWTKVVFVRNPYARLLSGWLDKIANTQDFDQPWQKWVPPVEGKNAPSVKDPKNFSQWISVLSAQTESSKIDGHFREQSALCGLRWLDYDYVGRFETLYEDLDRVLAPPFISPSLLDEHEAIDERTGERVKKKMIPWRKLMNYGMTQHTKNAASKIKEYYTPNLARLAYRRFREDFVRLNYSEELP